MKFRCASNAAIKNVKIARKKINFFSKIFSTKSPFFFKILIFRKQGLFSDSRGSSRHFDYLLNLFRSNNKAMNQLFSTSC